MSDNKDSVVRVEEQGNIHIAEDVVTSIAALAVSEVEGVASLAAGSGVAELLSKKSLSRGVKVGIEESKVNLDVYVLVLYGFPITTVAQKIQEKVKDAVGTMTGLEVGTISVHVNGVTFEKPGKK